MYSPYIYTIKSISRYIYFFLVISLNCISPSSYLCQATESQVEASIGGSDKEGGLNGTGNGADSKGPSLSTAIPPKDGETATEKVEEAPCDSKQNWLLYVVDFPSSNSELT